MEILKLSQDEGIKSLRELQRKKNICNNCGRCGRYVQRCLKTGETSFELDKRRN